MVKSLFRHRGQRAAPPHQAFILLQMVNTEQKVQKKKKRLCLPRSQFLLLTLWASMRFMTRSRSPCTGWSSANCGSTLYNQSTKACKASMNWPENSKASSNLCCLRKAYKIQGFKKKRRNAHNPDCLNSVSFYVRTVRNIDCKEMREMPRHFKSNHV